MQECTSYNIIAGYMPEKIRSAMMNTSRDERNKVNEIRLFSGRAVAYIYPEKILYLTASGLTANFRNTAVITVYPSDISAVIDALSHYSIHSCTREFQQGFFVLAGGVRAGISGNYSASGIITEVTGINFRIARNIAGSADNIFRLIAQEDAGVLICGGVNSGKTTVLRDLCRQVGNRKKVTLIDERNEISNVNNGTAVNDVGTLTNILVGCTRADGITSAVRTLSPDYIFCDEISGSADAEAIINAAGCGVNFCATIHAKNYIDLIKRPTAQKITDIFRYAVFLRGPESAGEISEIRRLDR